MIETMNEYDMNEYLKDNIKRITNSIYLNLH